MCKEKTPLRPGTKMTTRARLLAMYLDRLRGEPVEDCRLSRIDLLLIMRDREFAPEDNEHLGPRGVPGKI